MPGNAPKTSRHLEVERKFDVGESTVSPSFEGIAAVARVEKAPVQSLDAMYFDTPAHDLARNKVTLRRRTGGTDAGWHLKLPSGPDARTEVRAPLDASDESTRAKRVAGCGAGDCPRPAARAGRADHHPTGKPGAVRRRRRCAGRVQQRPRHRVVGGRSRRLRIRARPNSSGASGNWSSGNPVADNGTADTELLNRLSNRLLDAGAAPAGHGSKLARVLGEAPQSNGTQPADPLHRAVAEQIDQLLVWDRAVRADAPDAVHQMRVTTRKIRSLLRDAQDSFGSTDSEWVHRRTAGARRGAWAWRATPRCSASATSAHWTCWRRSWCVDGYGSVWSRVPAAGTRPGCGGR